MLPGGLAMHAEVMTPADAHLAANPGDWNGAAVILLDLMAGGRADRESPVYRAALRNAEALVRDDGAIITRTAFGPGELPADKCVIAIGKGASPLHAGIAEALAELLDKPTMVVDDADEHEIYLTRPEVLAGVLGVG
jgi:hypothetical protein